jgi:hypothetical protein
VGEAKGEGTERGREQGKGKGKSDRLRTKMSIIIIRKNGKKGFT